MLQEACSKVGGAAELASLIGVSPQRLSNWHSRGVPEEFCPLIEKATAGSQTCEGLNPDVAWGRIADKTWPWHPKGRPVVEVSRATDTRAA